MMHFGSNGYDLMMVGSWELFHWLIFAVIIAAILYPIGLILNRLGFSPFWSAFSLVPGLNLIGLWVVALGANSEGASKETSA